MSDGTGGSTSMRDWYAMSISVMSRAQRDMHVAGKQQVHKSKMLQ